jgi:PAS domain S-box-containing protein
MDGGWVNLLHIDDRESTVKTWMHCIATGEPYTVEVRQFHVADRSYRWVLTMARPLRDSEGRIIKWYGSCAEIHDRKVAERALAESERRLQEIIDAIPALVWSAHADGSADFVNQYYLDYVGMSMEEVVGWGWTAAVHPDDLTAMIANWKRVLESGRPGENQARLRRADGEYRWFLFRGNPVVDDAGEVKWFGVNIDIEERKRADDALRASELSLRRQTETIPQMLWSANPDGSFDYCNARFLNYTGTAGAAVMGDGWKGALHPDDQEPTARAWKHAVRTGEPYQVEVRKFCAAAGAYHWCVTSALPLRDEDGRIIKWYGASVDMHDWKQAQDELRETQAELAHMTRVMTMGHLTASIAHELNQPLAGIITNASTCMRMLASDPPNVTGARETARRTIRDGNRAAEVITRLRALFSKKDTTIEVVDLNTATQEVIALTLTELQRANVNLRVELAEALPFVKGDRVQLQQVIMNLILNAMQAMDGIADRAKELVVATQRDGADAVRVVVQDAGVGFDTATVEKLFHPFYTTKAHGMGIGLSVSRSIVENHQGRLWAERNDGPGATFLVSIPSGSDRSGAAVNA